jgi:hypothetical protein
MLQHLARWQLGCRLGPTLQRWFAVEKGVQQTDSPEGAKQPFVEEDSLASKREIK